MIANVDGYICEIPAEAAILEFRSDHDRHVRTAGSLVVRDSDGKRLATKSLATEFNLPQHPWWELVAEQQRKGSDGENLYNAG